MNELVERLSKAPLPVEVSRPSKTIQAFKDSVDRKFVHVMFVDTGTELGVQLDEAKTAFEKCDFEKASGIAHIEGGLILNYDKVRVIADVDLSTLEGKGYLKPVDDDEYKTMMKK